MEENEEKDRQGRKRMKDKEKRQGSKEARVRRSGGRTEDRHKKHTCSSILSFSHTHTYTQTHTKLIKEGV